MGFDHVAQFFRQDVRVDLGGGDVGMAQHLLDGTQISPALQQMTGKGMAQDVRRNLGRRQARIAGQAA
jgi:hypothetical protein